MFGNVVYYDKKKIDEYRAVVKGQRNLQIDEYEVSNDKGIQVDLKAFGADAKANIKPKYRRVYYIIVMNLKSCLQDETIFLILHSRKTMI